MKKFLRSCFTLTILFAALASQADINSNMSDEVLFDLAVGKVSVELDDLLKDIVDTYAPTEGAKSNIKNIINNKGIEAVFTSIDKNSKLPPAPFVVRVSSDHYDETLKKWVTVTGMGTLVMKDQNLILLSASHVTQGKNLKVTDSAGRVFPVNEKDRLANVAQDLEIISLNSGFKSTLVYDKSIGKIRSPLYDLTKQWPNNKTFRDYAFFAVSIHQHVAVMLSDVENLKYALGGFSLVDLIRVAELKGQTLEDRSAYVWDQLGQVTKSLLGSGYVSTSKMPPGLSGAPLIRDTPTLATMKTGKYALQLDGLVLAQHRTQNKTFYADSDQVANLIRRFDKGERGYVNPTRWRMSGGLTFRDYGNGMLETVLVKEKSGNAVSVDSGNAVSVDSGNAVSVDSGNAVSADSGKVGKSQTAIYFGNQVQNGKNVLGRWIERNGERTPVISMPFIEKEILKLNYELGGVIDPKTDLYELVSAKAQFMNRKMYMDPSVQCHYTIDPTAGLLVGIYFGEATESQGRRVIAKHLVGELRFTRDQLKKGFAGNKLLFKMGNGTGDLSGLFITDLVSTSAVEGLESVQGPYVNIRFADEMRRETQVNCYSSYDHRMHVLRGFTEDYVEGAHQKMGTFYGVQ